MLLEMMNCLRASVVSKVLAGQCISDDTVAAILTIVVRPSAINELGIVVELRFWFVYICCILIPETSFCSLH